MGGRLVKFYNILRLHVYILSVELKNLRYTVTARLCGGYRWVGGLFGTGECKLNRVLGIHRGGTGVVSLIYCQNFEVVVAVDDVTMMVDLRTR